MSEQVEEHPGGKTFVLTIATRSAAFGDGPPEGVKAELRRCLTDVWGRLDLYPLVSEGVIRDHNGNTVGMFGFEPDTHVDEHHTPPDPENPDGGGS